MAVELRRLERVPASRVDAAKGAPMTNPREPQDDLPSDDPEIEREAEKSREALEEVPEHGTDPMHQGP
jgi:hypothetical protein